MAYEFATKEWHIDGEYNFPNYYTLYNPSFKVLAVGVFNSSVNLNIVIHENGGSYAHQIDINLDGVSETDINLLVDTAVATLFPTATLLV